METNNIRTPSIRIPSIDGMRALSMFLVLFGHLNGTVNFYNINKRFTFGDIANLGVLVFFVISGYLITMLLINEENKNNTIDIKKFYIRRFVRLFPVFIVYLLCMFVLNFLGIIHIRNADWIFAVTYTMNYNYGRSWYFGHLWSLSVEEQFYLIWPLLLFKFKTRSAVAMASICFIGAIFFRLSTRLFLKIPDIEPFPSVADSIAAGCLLACLQDRLHQEERYLKFLRGKVFYAIPLSILLINSFRGYSIVSIFGVSIINFLIVILLDGLIHRKDTVEWKLLNSSFLVYFGKLSYSLYIWQQFFLNRNSKDWYNAFPINIIFALLISVISFKFVESPFLNLNKKYRV